MTELVCLSTASLISSPTMFGKKLRRDQPSRANHRAMIKLR